MNGLCRTACYMYGDCGLFVMLMMKEKIFVNDGDIRILWYVCARLLDMLVVNSKMCAMWVVSKGQVVIGMVSTGLFVLLMVSARISVRWV